MEHILELLDVKEKGARSPLVLIFKKYTNYSFSEINSYIDKLYEKKPVLLRLESDIDFNNKFLAELSDFGICIGDFSWHEENNGGGPRIAPDF